MEVANALAYYETQTITSVKSSLVQAPGSGKSTLASTTKPVYCGNFYTVQNCK